MEYITRGLALRTTSCCLLGLALAAPVAHADDTAFTLTEADFFAPFPTVLTATRLVQPLADAPVAMTVIDRELIEASSATSVPELLRLVPGFQVSFVEGIEAISTYHGFSDGFPRRMQVLVDGRSVYVPAVNGIIWAALPLTMDQIERIEVVRGPNAAAYGSNAFLGTINIITRSPETRDRLNTRLMTGTNNTYEAEIAHAGQFGDLAYAINANALRSDGFPVRPDDSDSRQLNLQGVYRPTQRDSLFFSAGVRDTDFESELFRFPRERTYESDFQQLRWTRQLAPGEDVSLQAYHNRMDSPDSFIAPIEINGVDFLGDIDYSLYTDRYDVELVHNLERGNGWRLSWGGGYRWDIVSGARLFDQPDDLERETARVFANLEVRASTTTVVNLGIMGEHFNDLGAYFSPRAAINWQPAPRHTLRFSAARAHRVPNLIELHGELKIDVLAPPPLPPVYLGTFIELQGNPNLQPERIDTVELAYLVELPRLAGTLDVRLFHSEVDNLIEGAREVSPAGRGPLRFTDEGDLRISGIEVQGDFRPTADSLVHLAYSYAEGDGEHWTRVDPSGNHVVLPEVSPFFNKQAVPKHTLTALVSQRLPGDWRISGTYYHLSNMRWLGEGERVDTQSRVDAKLSKRFRQPDGDIEVSLTVQNLLDDPYWEFTSPDGTATPPVNGNLSRRRVYAQVRFNFR
jgi:iron complex outermembrane receptor protein